MEISKDQFEKSLPEIKQALLEADFISIDAEFSGLHPPNIGLLNTDDLQQRYYKLKNCVKEFTIIQYGVCAFKKNSEGDFVAKPFNFYIFGNDTDSIQSRRVFTSQASSLSFLRSNKFDFNKLIDEGIPFYNYTEESTFVSSAQGTSMVNRKAPIQESSLTPSGKNFLLFNRNSIQKWLQGNTEKPLVIQVNSAFYKKLIYQEISEKYNGFLMASQRDSKHLQITRLKEEERREREKKIVSPTLNFRAVIELIKEAKCPVVAHNATLDILHTVDQFWEYLPNTIEDFKNVINNMWDNVVDTKYLAQFHPLLKNCFTSTALGPLYNTVSDELKTSGRAVSMAPGFDRYTKDANKTEHEAGYDAYMTGVVYLALTLFIHDKAEEEEEEEEEEGENKEEEEVNKDEVEKEGGETDDDKKEEGEASEGESDDDTEETMFLNKGIMAFYGKLYLMRCDHPYINLKGEEEVMIPHCPNKFFLQNIPTGMTNIGIEKLYPTIQPASVAWLNDSTAWIILKDDTKIGLAKLGVLGMTTVQSFLPGASREVEGKAYGITKDASRIELISHEKWAEVYGPKKAVNYNNLASTLEHVKNDSIIPSGGPSFDDIDIPTVNKREREDELEEKPSKIQKTD